MENLEGDHNPLDMLEGGLEDDFDDEEDVNPFHDAGIVHNAVGGRLEDRLIHALDLHGGGIKVEVADFYGTGMRKTILIGRLVWKQRILSGNQWLKIERCRLLNSN